MQVIGQLLALLIFSFLSVLADKTGISAESSQHSDSKARVTSSTATSSDSSSGEAVAAAAPTHSVSYPKHWLQASYYHPYYSHSLPGNVPAPPRVFPSPPGSARSEGGSLWHRAGGERGGEESTEEEASKAGAGQAAGGGRRVKRGGYHAPYFVGKRSLEESEEQVEQDELRKRSADSEADPQVEPPALDSQDPELPPELRQLVMLVGKRKLAPLFIGKREHFLLESRAASPMFVGRSAPMFVGKKSDEDSEEELNDDEDTLDKRPSPMFIGRRGSPMFVGRRASPMFVGRRASPMFVGRRASPMFVGKRQAPMFIGKRQAPLFIGKRRAPLFIGKRPSPMFVGKRPSPMFVGKRPSPMFVGKRPSPMFVGKRPTPMFVGKREGDPEGLNELLAALHTLQAAQHYRRLIQADKRHNAPFFVGKKSDPLSIEDVALSPASSAQDHNFR